MTMTAEVDRTRRRRLRQIAVVCALLVLLVAAIFTRGRFSLRTFVGVDSPGDALALFALSTLNFLAFVVLLFVLVRHLLKLDRERKQRRLGARLKTRMVVGSIGLSLVPTVILAVFSFTLIDISFKQLFLEPTQQMVTSAQKILGDYEVFELEHLRATARTIVRGLDLGARPEDEFEAVRKQLAQEATNHGAATIEFFSQSGTIRVDGTDAALEPIYRATFEEARSAVSSGRRFQQIVQTDDKGAIFLVVGVPAVPHVGARGLVMVRRFPPVLAEEFKAIDLQQRNSQELLLKQSAIRLRYVFTLSLIALVVLFVAVWAAVYVSRSVTEPIEALAVATDQVARGNLEHRIDYEGDGELGLLIDSFNVMAVQLHENRARLLEAKRELEESNMALDERRAYIETVLSGLSTGVVSIDVHGLMTTANPAAARLLGLGPGPYEGIDVGALIGPIRKQVEPLFRRARRAGTATSEIEVPRPDGAVWPASVTVSALTGPDGAYAGAVVTIEDLSELIKAERAAAWSEVARRMAHEIKNPLTPIQLSAERIARNFKRGTEGDAAATRRYAGIVEECTGTIVREVTELAHMVEEFSSFARLPQPRPEATDLNDVVRRAVALYQDRLGDTRLELDLEEKLPPLQLDSEQIKRVVVNLVDNALEALDGASERTVTVHTRYDEPREAVVLEIADTGHGIDPAVRDRLFLPHFSTRARGTGLGLAIVSHIVSDHKGTIRAESNPPQGARFVVELPVVA
jgi:two-component system, NtrC family, nitrogen regulation sensor histidine kinase NtrY